MNDKPKIVIFGSGVIGASVGAWVAENYDNVWFYDKPEVLDALEEKGITFYEGGNKANKAMVKPKVIRDLAEAKDADAIAVAVKNYSLEGVAGFIKEKVGDGPFIISMQNGLLNQQVLPKHFSKVIYCVVSFNAWMDEPGVYGYQKRGPLEWGTLGNTHQAEMKQLADIFNRGVPTVITDRISDAAHCKLVINLTNSLTTLIGHTFKPVTNMALFQKLLSGQLYEGVQIIKAAGVREVKLGGMPSWGLITAGAKLPRFISGPLFKKNVKKMVISSMAQDVIQRGGGDSELESINGYLLSVAEKHNHPAPFNKTIYKICKREFAKQDKFEPLTLDQVWEEVAKAL